jgi:tetratricopeptide (TPR) repeat protein
MGTSPSPTTDIAVSSSSRQSRRKIRPSKRLVAAGVVVLVIIAGLAVGLRKEGSWQWWTQKPPEESVHRQLELANSAIQKGDFAQAKSHLQAVLAVCPLNAQVDFLMARTCRRAHDSEALGYLNLAESLGWPRDQIVLERRLLQAESGDPWSVEDVLLDELNRLPPDEQVILEGLVKGYLNSARFGDAADIASTWIKRYPDDWQAHLYRGRGYQGLGQLEDALADYQNVLNARPESVPATLWSAETFLALHDYQNALDTYQIYRKMAPDDWQALYAIAECQFSLGRSESRATVETLLNDHPQHQGGLLLAAKSYIAEDAPAKALPYLRKAMELGTDPEVLQALISVLRKLNQPEEADQLEKQYRQFLDKAKQFRELKEKIQSEPRDPGLRHQVGMLALELGYEKEAWDWFQTVFFIDPGYPPTHLFLAEYWSKHGQPERGNYHRRRAEGKLR